MNKGLRNLMKNFKQKTDYYKEPRGKTCTYRKKTSNSVKCYLKLKYSN